MVFLFKTKKCRHSHDEIQVDSDAAYGYFKTIRLPLAAAIIYHSSIARQNKENKEQP
jgi:hypothetical protein